MAVHLVRSADCPHPHHRAFDDASGAFRCAGAVRRDRWRRWSSLKPGKPGRQGSVRPKPADDRWRRARPWIWALGREAKCLAMRGPADSPAEVLRCPVRLAHFACLLVFGPAPRIQLQIRWMRRLLPSCRRGCCLRMWRAFQAPSGTTRAAGITPDQRRLSPLQPRGCRQDLAPSHGAPMPAYSKYANTTSRRTPSFSHVSREKGQR